MLRKAYVLCTLILGLRSVFGLFVLLIKFLHHFITVTIYIDVAGILVVLDEAQARRVLLSLYVILLELLHHVLIGRHHLFVLL